MTTVDEAVQPPAGKPAKLSKSVAIGGGLLTTFGIYAAVVGLARVALHRGFGISVPFLPVFLLVVAVVFTVERITGLVARTWHDERVKAEASLIGAQMAVQHQFHAAPDMAALLDSILKPPADTDNSGYL